MDQYTTIVKLTDADRSAAARSTAGAPCNVLAWPCLSRTVQSVEEFDDCTHRSRLRVIRQPSAAIAVGGGVQSDECLHTSQFLAPLGAAWCDEERAANACTAARGAAVLFCPVEVCPC